MKPLVNATLIREHPLARGLLAGWLLNEGNGRRTNDFVGVKSRAWGTTTSGVNLRGEGARFPGSQWIAVPSGVWTPSKTTPFTLFARVKYTQTSNGSFLVSGYPSVGGVIFRTQSTLGPYTAGQILFVLCNSTGANSISCSSSRSFNDGRWHNVVALYDGSASANGMALVVDGDVVPLGTQGPGGTGDPGTLGDVGFRLGARMDGAESYSGRIDSEMVWTRRLSITEAIAVCADPYQMFDRSPASGIWVPSNYAQALTLTAETGVFTVSGQDANLTPALLLDAETGQFTVTGQDAALLSGILISAETGQFVIDGQAAGLIVNEGSQGAGGGALRKNPRIGRTNRRPQIANIEYDRDTRDDAFTVLLCS